VFSLLLKQCRDAELAEELTQAAFVRLVQGFTRYQERGRFEPWLFRIAMNLLRDEMRRRKRQAKSFPLSPADPAGGERAGRSNPSAELPDDSCHDPFQQLSHAEQIEQMKQAV